MPTIIPIPGKTSVVTSNGTTINVSSASLKLTSQVMSYAVTGMTADAHGNRWIEKLAGLCEGTISCEAPLNLAADADLRLTGDTVGLVQGLTATFQCLFAAGYGWSATVLVTSITPSFEVQGSSPAKMSIEMDLTGAPTFINS